ncbi:glycerophosphodiester phosphodiesterase [Galactobacter caseinivorans]|uniref:GP-PDE domain-containing protein n=1 Tax=Galactobacter caseinivorans TaxID=2676123 RepID=A0A496PJS7_9MICC|nr:glycerophosphodiester phosphodiesterase [Galactobacter caseinivorans]RKW70736.1 hypothetical protein DWQ67_06435 [Galactobacter caseinivorans]
MRSSTTARRPLLLIFGTFIAAFLAGCAAPTPPAEPEHTTSSVPSLGAQPLIVAHRGGADEGAEGALESLVASAKEGFPVEFDLHPLKDGQWAVAHDDKVDRILKGKSGPVSAMTSREWKASCIEGPDGVCGTPATWDDVVKTLPAGTPLVPEIKNGEIKAADMAAAVKKADLVKTTTVQTFRLAEAKELAAAGITTLYLADAKTEVDVDAVAAANIAFIGVNKSTSRDIVQRAHASGLKVWVWTVDERADADAWRSAGADGLFTDLPKTMRGWWV